MLFFSSTISPHDIACNPHDIACNPHNIACNPYNKCDDSNDLFYYKYIKKIEKRLTYGCQYCRCTVYHSHKTEWEAKRNG